VIYRALSEENETMNNALFIEALLQRVAELTPVYEAHLNDNGTLLPHVFMGDVTRWTIAEVERYREETLRKLLSCLEDGLLVGPEDVRELIIVSFVENLMGETTALSVLKPLMGEKLKTEVERICKDW
jgi:hypothetical protein